LPGRTVTVYLPDELYERLRGMNRSRVVQEALRRYLEEERLGVQKRLAVSEVR